MNVLKNSGETVNDLGNGGASSNNLLNNGPKIQV